MVAEFIARPKDYKQKSFDFLVRAWESDRSKTYLLPKFLKYGKSGIDFLIQCLEDPELEIRATAYKLLGDIESDKVQDAIAPGLLFNPGDKIFYVRKSTMWFDDHCYRLHQPSNVDKERHLITYNDYINQNYKIIRFDKAAYIITFAPYFINYQQAKLSAESLHNKRISKVSITEFDLKDDRETIKQWCDCYGITQAVNDLQKEKDLKQGLDRWRKIYGISDSQDYIYWSTVESYLKSSKNLDLLNWLWQDLVGSFAFVTKVVFDKTTYLSIDPYYSQIVGYKDTYRYSYGQDVEELSLSSEESETNSLLAALNSSQLEIRNLAYQLLQGIKSENAQQAICQGVRLNPGDKIYSIYQAGRCYTDESLQALWDYVDYPEQLRCQLKENDIRDRVEQSQRIYCYTNKQQAEAAAEALHRQLIKETKIGFEWRKENPNFDAKQWCIANNFPYKSEWDNLSDYQIVWAIKDIIWMDDKLSDSFRRSRCIYHPKHIDTWCDDNQIEYERNLDNWENYAKLIDYLDLPENIKLLSKFWKDGIGHFAFIKEEIVLQKVYIKIGEELHSQAEASNLFAVSKEYREAAGNLLVEILENSKTQAESKSKARKVLQYLDWDEIPF